MDGYLEEKVSEPNVWRQKHVMVWEEANGPVPAGHCVSFIDGDQSNVDLSNLELITRRENLHINLLRCPSQTKEVQPTVRLMGKLKAKVFEREKQEN
ncbi:HNH endonuclease signature motif containing protein [Endozoicomonas lisbonensis]|uniref:HNH endonuclease signature motif containing protein n=1 Tax=Endozoicomonas lisbonensis TaxID=3120522 RepID=UPI0033909314